jgi:hypothetical protein
MRPQKGPSLRQNTRFNPSTMKIGLFVRAVREPEKVNKKKNLKKKGHERYISPMRGGGTPEDGSMKFCTFVESLDVIKCANFHVYLMINLPARWGSKMSFSLWNAYGSYYIALRFRAGKWLLTWEVARENSGIGTTQKKQDRTYVVCVRNTDNIVKWEEN